MMQNVNLAYCLKEIGVTPENICQHLIDSYTYKFDVKNKKKEI